MSKVLIEVVKAVTTGSLTLGGVLSVQAYKSGRLLMSSAPAPGVADRLIGGLVSVAKGASTVPYAREATVLAACAAGVWGAYRLRKIRAVVEDGVLGLKERMGFKMKEMPSDRARDIISESLREQSSERSTVMPKIQVKVGTVKDGVFVVYGSAVRIWDAVVMPAHVLSAAKDDEGDVWLKGSQGCMRFNVKGFVDIETDLVAKILALEDFSRIGMAQVNLYECIPATGEFVSICGVRGEGTVGKLMHDQTAFGKVTYSGTTMPGYSGAPYMKGSAVVGIHCWGGKVNGGYSASFVKVLIQRMMKQSCESSEDWLMDKFNKKSVRKADIRFEPGNDEAWIRYNGQYHIVSGDVFRKAKGFDYLGYDDGDSMRVEESLLHSGESKSLESPGASGDVSQPGEVDLYQIKSLTKQLSKLTNKHLQQLKSTPGSSSAEVSTVGLLSQQKPN